jgi:hypothetical protein
LALTPMAQASIARAILRDEAAGLTAFAPEDCIRAYGPRYRPLLTRMEVVRQIAQDGLSAVITLVSPRESAA